MYNIPLIWLLLAGYQMVTKLYRENVWKLPSYQIIITEEVICTIYTLNMVVTSWLPNGYQAL